MNIQAYTFAFVGNHLGVDFVNTEILNQGEKIDLLPDFPALHAWAQQAGLSLAKPEGSTALPRVHAFRTALRELFLAAIDHRPATDQALTVLNQSLQTYTVTHRLRMTPPGSGYQLDVLQENMSVEHMLGKIAYESATLLASNQASMLKRCGNKDCVLIFVDSSRSHKRRWCSMEVCGNRAKVATHYRNKQLQ